jgi:hypothetical protein
VAPQRQDQSTSFNNDVVTGSRAASTLAGWETNLPAAALHAHAHAHAAAAATTSSLLLLSPHLLALVCCSRWCVCSCLLAAALGSFAAAASLLIAALQPQSGRSIGVTRLTYSPFVASRLATCVVPAHSHPSGQVVTDAVLRLLGGEEEGSQGKVVDIHASPSQPTCAAKCRSAWCALWFDDPSIWWSRFAGGSSGEDGSVQVRFQMAVASQ